MGVGQLILDAAGRGVKKIIVALGGSSTNDCGCGAAAAIGVRFINNKGEKFTPTGGTTHEVSSIDISGKAEVLNGIEIVTMCDIDNPMYGPTGASHVFGPQKGATKEIIDILDDNLKHYADIIKKQFGKDVLNIPGAGAAGGLGAGLMAFLNGTLKKGIEIVIEHTGLEEKIKNADMVWTGEGSIDFQTQYGKTPIGVASVARKYNKPVIAFAGKVGEDIDCLYEMGIDSIFGIMKGVTPLEESLVKGPENVEKTAENIIRLINSLLKIQ